MPRSSKNNTDGAVFTYHERKNMGYGSENLRIGMDSVRPFDCCCLSLQPCRNPVVSPDGFLFEKEYILQHLIQEKKNLKKRLQAWELEVGNRDNQSNLEKESLKDAERQLFEVTDNSIHSSSIGDSKKGRNATASNAMEVKRKKLESNFWLPDNTPHAQKSLMVPKPSLTPTNPLTGKPLRMNQLMDVKFTPIKSDASEILNQASSKPAWKHMCPVCHKTLTNSSNATFLKLSGNVICGHCVKRFVEKDQKDPVTGQAVKLDVDLIQLKSGGTAFSASKGEPKSVSKYNPSIRV